MGKRPAACGGSTKPRAEKTETPDKAVALILFHAGRCATSRCFPPNEEGISGGGDEGAKHAPAALDKQKMVSRVK